MIANTGVQVPSATLGTPQVVSWSARWRTGTNSVRCQPLSTGAQIVTVFGTDVGGETGEQLRHADAILDYGTLRTT